MSTIDNLPEVETAKALMNEAMIWSVMKWLREKKRVRKTADLANAALDQLRAAVGQRWPAALKAAYEAVGDGTNGAAVPRNGTDPETTRLAAQIKEFDSRAQRARMDAEETFNKAEKQLSTSLAREGCRKAIYSWELHEKAIRKAESVIHSK